MIHLWPDVTVTVTPLASVIGPTDMPFVPAAIVVLAVIVLLLRIMPFVAKIDAPDIAPVAAKLVPVAAPMTGVTSVGVVANTMLPLPVVTLPRAVIVPDVGSVSDVLPVAVKVCEKAPAWVKGPASVIVFVPLLATPVPP